jgi:putative ABC transport system substrate-binding protein
MRRRDFIKLITGSAAAWPFAARAEQATPVIGFLNGQSADLYEPFVAAFRQGLKETGFVEGQNVAIEYRWAEARLDRLPALASDLVSRQVAVIVASGAAAGLAVVAAKAVTTTIPIVFASADDPVKLGLVPSLNRPGGNVTGVSFFAGVLGAKRLELLRECVPNATVIAFLVNPDRPNAESYTADIQIAAHALRRKIVILHAREDSDIDAAFAKLVEQKAGALVVSADAFFNARRNRLVALAARYTVPTIYEGRDFAVAGGLMSYGPSIADVYRQVGVYTGKILKGAKPMDLPVLQPTRFELVINLKTAKTLGVTVPFGLLNAADEVIE